jgi:serine/threonine protein kinase/tetratricopeptide (TPR) repeat protein
MADAFDSLKAALADRYALEHELGRGGMATVYLARDLKHERLVAVKVLRPELAASLGAERFLREIKIAANLNHPHVLPLFDSGEADGFLFYVMPYVDGESLRDRLLRERQLPIDDALTLTREVASALTYAHDCGFIHRDIKPENIMLSAGGAVVADFGIARAVSAAGGEQLTATGMAVGTPAYMSPEQATAEEVDVRTDIYSLGCVLYEMLGGEPPFTGPTPNAVISKKLSEPTPRISVLREIVPPGIESAILKALAKAPVDRFVTAGEFSEELTRTQTGAVVSAVTVKPNARRRLFAASVVVAVAIGIGLMLLLQKQPDTGPHRIAVLPLENLGSSDEDYFCDGLTDEITSRLGEIGALQVISRTSAAHYRDSEKTIRQIAEDLSVAFVLMGTMRTDRAPDGSGQVRVTPELIRVSDNSQVWTNRYTASLEPGEIFRIQADIAEQVAGALNVTLLAPVHGRSAPGPTDNMEAYEAYLRGNQYVVSWEILPTDRRRAIGLYERAIELDPRFAEAHARLSVHYSMLSAIPSERERALPLASRHAERALELKPGLAFGYLARAYYLLQEYQNAERVLPDLERALAADQNSGEILQHAAKLYLEDLGDWELALTYALRALELDPLNADNTWGVAYAYFALRQFAQAEPYIDRSIQLAPDRYGLYMYKAWLYLCWQGDIDRASEVLQTAVQKVGVERPFAVFLGPGSHWWVSRMLAADEWYRQMVEQIFLGPPDIDTASYFLHKAALYDGLGDRERARTYYDSLTPVAKARVRDGDGPPFMIAMLHTQLGVTYAGQGNKGEAIREGQQALELFRNIPGGRRIFFELNLGLIYAMVGEYDAALDEIELVLSKPHYTTLQLLAIDPTLAPLREHPRYRELVERK